MNQRAAVLPPEGPQQLVLVQAKARNLELLGFISHIVFHLSYSPYVSEWHGLSSWTIAYCFSGHFKVGSWIRSKAARIWTSTPTHRRWGCELWLTLLHQNNSPANLKMCHYWKKAYHSLFVYRHAQKGISKSLQTWHLFSLMRSNFSAFQDGNY